jgi:hypothetical protein
LVTTQEDREYDARQLRLMLDRIEAFRRAEVGFGKLIVDLEALLGALRNPDEKWKNDFNYHWGKLEDIRAAMLYGNHKGLGEGDLKTVADALGALESILQSMLGQQKAG